MDLTLLAYNKSISTPSDLLLIPGVLTALVLLPLTCDKVIIVYVYTLIIGPSQG